MATTRAIRALKRYGFTVNKGKILRDSRLLINDTFSMAKDKGLMTKDKRYLNDILDIAAQFEFSGAICSCREYGDGNINRTYLISLDDRKESYFILQCINTEVFRQPELVMSNMCILSEHIQQKLETETVISNLKGRNWIVPRVLLTKNGQNFLIAENGTFWRAISFIPNSESFSIIDNIEQGKEIGYGLGVFHSLISDLAIDKLADTLPGFHITPGYLEQYNKVLNTSNISNSPETNYCNNFISNRTSWTSILEEAKHQKKLQIRTIHGDPKVNNILFDCNSRKSIAMIDLDTVKPGLVHYDIGDCLRSGCNLLGEETQEWEKVSFETELAEAILQGYFETAQKFLTTYDYQYIYDAIALISFELGLRFFTDYLAGNVYFKINYPENNLMRALVQFKLTESIESQANMIRKLTNLPHVKL